MPNLSSRSGASTATPTGQPPGTVAVTCTAHGVFVAWCTPPTPTALVRCPTACA